jgi:hypothetical protein
VHLSAESGLDHPGSDRGKNRATGGGEEHIRTIDFEAEPVTGSGEPAIGRFTGTGVHADDQVRIDLRVGPRAAGRATGWVPGRVHARRPG